MARNGLSLIKLSKKSFSLYSTGLGYDYSTTVEVHVEQLIGCVCVLG